MTARSDGCTIAGVSAPKDDGERAFLSALERASADPDEVGAADRRIAELLERVDHPEGEELPGARPSGAAAPLRGVAMRTAIPLAVDGRRVTLRVGAVEATAELGERVSPEVVRAAIRGGEAVLVELPEGEPPRVVAALRTREPAEVVQRARTLTLEAEDEVLLRAGRSALRLRRDGDVELVGSRLSLASRGLFRLVGRMLRLN
ncbi:MAG: hypothetical protein FJ096_01300 [Deltaproteobacteria bacterium]|nr:hypothetical protein [Deltaproteobacteria bacterium]